MNSNVIRFDYALLSQNSSVKLTANNYQLVKLAKARDTVSELSVGEKVFKVASSGEFLMTIEGTRKIIWVDGVLLTDFGSPTASFKSSLTFLIF